MSGLGPRASLLLGMLGAPQTSAEILSGIDKALEQDALMDVLKDLPVEWGSPAVTLRSLSDGGTVEIDRLLDRLQGLALVDFVDDPLDGTRLWRRNECLAA